MENFVDKLDTAVLHEAIEKWLNSIAFTME